jgi:hypothetical protein
VSNILTFKPLLSDKSAFAAVLAFIEIYGENPSISFNASYLNEIIGNIFFSKFELLSDKAYRDTTIDKIKSAPELIKLAKSFKKSSVTPFMKNVSESIEKGYLSFTDLDFKKGDYIFCLSPIFILTNYLLRNEQPNENQEEQRKASMNLFNELKSNPSSVKYYLDEIKKADLEDELNKFGPFLLDLTLRESLKVGKIDQVIKGLVDNEFGHFEQI